MSTLVTSYTRGTQNPLIPFPPLSPAYCVFISMHFNSTYILNPARQYYYYRAVTISLHLPTYLSFPYSSFLPVFLYFQLELSVL